MCQVSLLCEYRAIITHWVEKAGAKATTRVPYFKLNCVASCQDLVVHMHTQNKDTLPWI